MPKNLKIVFGIFILGAVIGLGTAIPRLIMLQFNFGLFQTTAHVLLNLVLIWGFQNRSRLALWVARLVISLGLVFGCMACLVLGCDCLTYSIEVGGPYLQLLIILPVILFLYGYILWVLFTRPVREYFTNHL